MKRPCVCAGNAEVSTQFTNWFNVAMFIPISFCQRWDTRELGTSKNWVFSISIQKEFKQQSFWYLDLIKGLMKSIVLCLSACLFASTGILVNNTEVFRAIRSVTFLLCTHSPPMKWWVFFRAQISFARVLTHIPPYMMLMYYVNAESASETIGVVFMIVWPHEFLPSRAFYY